MKEKPVIILGAGATKACGGPLTDEIIPSFLNRNNMAEHMDNEIIDREELLDLSTKFLRDCFYVPTDDAVIAKDKCPPLPMVLSMLRRSTLLNLPLGSYQGDDLIKAKRAIEYAIFAVIEATLRRIPDNKRFHSQLLQPLYSRNVEPTVISMNYDVIVDNAMFILSEQLNRTGPPDYGVDIATIRYKEFCQHGTFGKLLKIHGSLNWMYCEKCHRLDLFVSKGMRTAKALNELYYSVPFGDAYSCRGTECRNSPACDGNVSPILITPTYVKDYDNPHIDSVWKKAEHEMQSADRAVIIGYSLPTDDVEIAMLLKRGLDGMKRKRITIVEYVEGDINKPKQERMPIGAHPTGIRFQSLFGPDLDWHTTGFQGWLEEKNANNGFPFAAS